MDTNDTVVVMQWNCQGIREKKDEILDLVNHHKPSIIGFQETKLWSYCKVSIPNFNVVRRDGHLNRTPHGGVAIYIHSDIPFIEVPLNANIQAIAIQANIGQMITFCNLYLPGSRDINADTLTSLLNQLPKPYVILGDFNSHNTLWGCRETNSRGRTVESVINENECILLNDGSPTHIYNYRESAIDLTLVSPEIAPLLDWSALSSPGGSDHCPIIITYFNNTSNGGTDDGTERWNYKRADWDAFAEHKVWKTVPEETELMTTEELMEDLYNRFYAAAKECIPTYKKAKYFPKPWWTEELKQSKQKRERLYQKYRRNKTEQNLIAWKRARAQHKYSTKQSEVLEGVCI